MLVYVHFHRFINLMLHSHLQSAVCSLQISYTGDVPYLKLDIILILAFQQFLENFLWLSKSQEAQS